MALTTKMKSLLGAVARWEGLSGPKVLEPMPQDNVGGMGTFGDWGAEPVSMQFLLGMGKRQARSRQMIYAKWQLMLGDPIVSTAMRMHITGALGGHEAKGDMVFFEKSEKCKGAKVEKLVDELKAEIQPLCNSIAPTLGFNGIGFGDGFGRIYGLPRLGVRNVLVDELVYPPLIQPYERGGKTIGFTASTGERYVERLSIAQMMRMKMPRTLYVPQQRVIEKAQRTALAEDDPEKLPAMPALVGGSFLDGAEEPYDNLCAALAGLIGQRVLDSLDESILGVQAEGMTKEQRATFMKSFTGLLKRSHDYAKQAALEGKPLFGRIRHLIPIFGEKQLIEFKGAAGASAGGGQARGYSTIEDVMLYARLLSGAMGTDLSMLGFADQLSGGLGDGGFFRVSVNAAERARLIRGSFTQAFNHLARVHLFLKYGVEFTDAELPWEVKFFSGISALERERQETFTNAVNTGALLAQMLASLRDLGMPKEANELLLKNYAAMDEADAAAIADALTKAKPPEGMAGPGGPGGMGGPEAPEAGEIGDFATNGDGAE